MIDCPPAERLTALLDETLPESDRSALDGHLAECATCQDLLERLTDAPDLAAWLAASSVANPTYPFLAPAMRPGELGRLNGYAIRAEIGRGGMGLVLRGWDEALARDVAIKVLRPEDDAALGEARFSREARAVAQLRHDHVVPLFAVDRTADGRPFLVMPFIPGATLRERLRGGPIPQREAAELLRQIADGLSAAHAAGLIHRDVKPANILLDESDGRAKLTDFGLVRTSLGAETLSPEGILAGTPAYMSPEQASIPEQIDARSDVYALGVALYECLTGTVPFRGTPLAVIEQHRSIEPVPPRRLNPGLAKDIETVCLKALAKSPANRYASAAAFRDDLARWLEGRPILARPAGSVEHARRWCMRNPLPVAMIVVSLIGSVAAAAGWWQAGVKAADASRSAVLARQREGEADAARILAQEKAALAEERSALALGAITTLVTKAQNLADRTPGTLRLKKQLNEAALADLRKLAASTAKVSGVDRQIVLAHQKLGDALNLLGQTDEAFREWNFALATAEQLSATDPNDTDSRRDAARAHYMIGYAQNGMQDQAAAFKHMNAAIGILEDLQKKLPDDQVLLYSLSGVYSGRADVERVLGQTAASITDSERALAINRKLLGFDSINLPIRSGLYFNHNKLAYAHLLLRHDYPAAERHFREELRLAMEQCARTPDDNFWQRNYHIALLDLSSVQQRQCDFAGGEKSARDALGWLEGAAKHDPDNGLSQRDYAMGLIHLGNIQLSQGKLTKAEDSFTSALKVFDRFKSQSKNEAIFSSDITQLCVSLASICERQGRFADAAAWMDRVIATIRSGPMNTLQPSQNAMLLERQILIRDAYLLVPKALADSKVIENQEPELAIRLTAMRARSLARRGDYEQAIREIQDLCGKHPNHPVPVFCLSVVCGQAAALAKTDRERTEHVEAGVAALIKAIRIDRTSYEYVILAPEMNAIRSQPSFLSQLRKVVDGP